MALKTNARPVTEPRPWRANAAGPRESQAKPGFC
jgi:hypothetical protein